MPILGKVKLKDLSLQAVERFYGRLRDAGVGLSNIRYSHRVLHAALEAAAKRGITGRNAAHGATLPKRAQREMSILNEQQVGVFLVAASTSRYWALFHLAVATGMRFSELRGLSWSDVDWIKGTITVRRQIQEVSGKGSVAGAPKTHSGVRTILLGEACLNSLRQQRQQLDTEEASAGTGWQEQGLIFPSKVGTPFVPLVVRRDFANALQAANLPRNPVSRFAPHCRELDAQSWCVCPRGVENTRSFESQHNAEYLCSFHDRHAGSCRERHG